MDEGDYRSCIPLEGKFEDATKHPHTNDRVEYSPEFSWAHLVHFVKIATAFSIELAWHGSKEF
ncbi:hypothetical protein BKA62DRAFT_776858 [Auriculariales sp. MPI-PUGE-AT-0066]|nr:hypothetical protein BKA62DRAFT_776858 [Auriculariales sp. MPI-PUGE-AT-0066]